MSILINFIISVPFAIRVAIFFCFTIFFVWGLFGRIILWILSFLPFILKYLFIALFWLIETPISFLHRKIGSLMGGLDNMWSQLGRRIDCFIDNWYNAWHRRKKKENTLKIRFLVWGICVGIVVFPNIMNLENEELKIGENIYLHCESLVINWLYNQEWYKSKEESVQVVNKEVQQENTFEVEMVVAGLNSSLLVRDIPSMEGSILDRLYNDNKVIWHGQLVFAETDNGRIEPWIKITMKNGIEGWSRLHYLYPLQYESEEFSVEK